MKILVGFCFLVLTMSPTVLAQNGANLFATNRVELWQKVVDTPAGDNCRYIRGVPVIESTKRTTKAATAMTDIFYHLSTLKTNACGLFMTLSALQPQTGGSQDSGEFTGLGLNPKGKNLKEVGLTEDSAFLLMEKMGARFQKMQEEEERSFAETYDAIDVEAAAKGKQFVPGASFGIRCASIVGKYLGKSDDIKDVVAGLRTFAQSRGYIFELKIHEKPKFDDFQNSLVKSLPVLLTTGAGQFFAVAGYLKENGMNYLIVHDGATAKCRFGKTGEDELIAEDNVPDGKGEISPGVQFIRSDNLSEKNCALTIVKWSRDLSEEKKIIRESKVEGSK